MTTSGHAVQIVKTFEDHTYELDDEELKKILLNDKIRGLPVVVVSVAGPKCSGKSFLLNFILRYLTASPSARADGSWIGTDKQLDGFCWCSESTSTTMGIQLWSEPVIMDLPSGDKMAVILMDTQGTFNNESTFRNCFTMFGLCTLLSSMQVYNVPLSIREGHLQYLDLFTNYGNMVKDQQGSKAFQVLEFLVRDWQLPNEYEHGATGGEQFFNNFIRTTANWGEMYQLGDLITPSFERVSCFLMPNPGLQHLTKETYSKKISHLAPKFVKHLNELVSFLFGHHGEKLMPKRVKGEIVLARDLYTYFKTYISLFISNGILTAQAIMDATDKTAEIIAKEAF